MSDSYIYQDEDRVLRIAENQGDAYVRISKGKIHYFAIDVPPGERRDAAQALAGDGFDVVERLADWERELLDKQTRIDPADVKVGDVVEVEADDGSWMVRGEVIHTEPGSTPFRLRIPILNWDTVRLVRRAEPEPDPEQVEALTEALKEIHAALGNTFTQLPDTARELVRRGVTVRKDT